jgi:hypothetical protein
LHTCAAIIHIITNVFCNWCVFCNIQAIEKVITEKSLKRKIIWNLVSFDAYVHFNGYTENLKRAVNKLNDEVLKWKKLGYAIVLHSDHGMTPCRINKKDVNLWNEINSDKYCLMPSGGAGRVLWSYPKVENKDIVFQKLKQLLKNKAIVIKKDDVFAMGLLDRNNDIENKIGDIICIATKREFPSPYLEAKYEHGGLTKEEMIIPLFIWK